MSLYKRGDYWHFDFWIDGNRFRGSTGETRKAKAESVLAEKREQAKQAVKLGGRVEREPLTLREVADKWFSMHVAGKKTALTVAMRLKILFRHIDGELPVSAIGAMEITNAILSRRAEPIRQSPKNGEPRFPSNSTVNRDLIDSTLRPILNFAEELKEPVQRIKWKKLRLKEPKGRTRSFTSEELDPWRAGLPEWHRPLFNFIMRYGVRLDEAFFPPSALNVEACEIVLFDPKNGIDHPLQILDEDIADLAARKTRAEAAGLSTIWFRDRGGELTPIHPRAFQSASKKARDQAGVTNARPVHDLRHHAATTLYRSTGNLKLVQDLLNHQSITSSARYAHTNKADLRKALSETYSTKIPTIGENEPKNPKNSKTGRGT